MANSSEISLANNNPIKFNDADNSAFVGIDAPTTVSGSYTLTLPAAVGSASQALVTTDGAGTLGFTSTSTFGISTGKSIAMAIVFG
jgi:glycine cleavage system aminomethyltransferase T